jgi:hypothetical protein
MINGIRCTKKKISRKILPPAAELSLRLSRKEGKGLKPMTTSSHRPRNRDCYVYKPNRKVRLHNRRVLVELLLEEITHGSGLSGMYAGLLVNTLLAEEPELRREYSNLASEPSEASEAAKRPQRLGPLVPRLRLDHPRR